MSRPIRPGSVPEAAESRLLEWLASCRTDPLRYVLGAFPWGEAGTVLANEPGPNEWQRWVLGLVASGLVTLAMAVRIAVASGHGVGKSALVAWIIKWSVETAPDTRGVVTANTETQLRTKTWAELGKWHNMSITRDSFVLTATAFFSRDPTRERTWRVDAIPWSEKNPEAFAGLHNKGKRMFLIMDEASAIVDTIWETAEGAMTDADTEILWLAFGNPTRNTGRFKECFPGGRFEPYWTTRSIDSRTVPQSNKDELARWVQAYGEDSDFVRIRVMGQFPRVGDMEFFSAMDIRAAAEREPEVVLQDPLALGVDVARYGKNASVIFPRKGRDARTYERIRFQGLSTIQLADRIFEAHLRYHSDGIMIDGGGVGGGVVDACRAKALFVYEVQFGAKDDTPHTVWGSAGERYANKRSGMYGALRAWLRTGVIPAEPALLSQFHAIRYTLRRDMEIQLLSKEDMLRLDPDAEFDDIDALALTFAHALAPNEWAGGIHARAPPLEHEYDPIAAFEAELVA